MIICQKWKRICKNTMKYKIQVRVIPALPTSHYVRIFVPNRRHKRPERNVNVTYSVKDFVQTAWFSYFWHFCIKRLNLRYVTITKISQKYENLYFADLFGFLDTVLGYLRTTLSCTVIKTKQKQKKGNYKHNINLTHIWHQPKPKYESSIPPILLLTCCQGTKGHQIPKLFISWNCDLPWNAATPFSSSHFPNRFQSQQKEEVKLTLALHSELLHFKQSILWFWMAKFLKCKRVVLSYQSLWFSK